MDAWVDEWMGWASGSGMVYGEMVERMHGVMCQWMDKYVDGHILDGWGVVM